MKIIAIITLMLDTVNKSELRSFYETVLSNDQYDDGAVITSET
jgi:hypothetical protein